MFCGILKLVQAMSWFFGCVFLKINSILSCLIPKLAEEQAFPIISVLRIAVTILRCVLWVTFIYELP